MSRGRVELGEPEIEVIPEGQVGPYLADHGMEDNRPTLDRLRDAATGGRGDEVAGLVGELNARDRRRVQRDEALLRSTLVAVGADRAVEAMTTIGLSDAQKITTAGAANILTLDMARAVISPLTLRRQAALAGNGPVITAVRGLGAATAVFVELCADSGRYATAVRSGATFAEWSMEDMEAFKASVLVGEPNKAEWCKTFKALNNWGLLLDIEAAAGAAATWREAALPYYGRIVASLTTPLGADEEGNRRATALFSIYGDGTGIRLNDKFATFGALYNATLETSGEHKSPGNFSAGEALWKQAGITGAAAETFSTDYEDTYKVVRPESAAMDLFFEQYRVLPRAHIDTAAAIYMCRDWFSKWVIHVTAAPASRRRARDVTAYQTDDSGSNISLRKSTFQLATSYYMSDNSICMRSMRGSVGRADTSAVDRTVYQRTDAGTTTETAIGGAVDGAPGAAAADRINMFQNHATHEVGHAVGNRQVTLKNEDGTVWDTTSGNRWATEYGGWARQATLADARRDFSVQHGWDVAWDANNYNLPKEDGSGNIVATGLEIRDLLCDCVEHGRAAVSGGLADATKFGAAGKALIAIRDCADSPPDFETLGLWNRLFTSPDNQFAFPGGFQGGADKVFFWCTRASPSGYFAYSRAAYNNQVSEYGLSSPAEMFAEIYTAWFSGNRGIAAVNGKSPADLFTRLERATAADFGAVGSDQPNLGGSVGGADSHGSLPGEILQSDSAAAPGAAAGGSPGASSRPASSFAYRRPFSGG